MQRISPLMFLITLLVGCAGTAKGPTFATTETSWQLAILYIYRTESSETLRTPDVEVNGARVAELPVKTYTVLKLQPSVYTVKVSSLLAVASYKRFTVQAGKSYYLRVSHDSYWLPAGAGRSATATLIYSVQSEEPPTDIVECSLIQPMIVSVPLEDPTRRGLAARSDGTALLAPAGLSYEERVKNVNECFAEARRDGQSGVPLTNEQTALLRGRSTETFFRSGRPVVNRDDTPSMWESAVRPPGGYQSIAVSDRYVLCFLSRGYIWPDPSATGSLK